MKYKYLIPYSRFSTKEQRHGDSQRRQDENIRRFCEQQKLQLDLSFNLNDPGVSAYRGKNATHGKLATFLESARAGRIRPGTVLGVEKLDRLTRQEILPALNLFTDIINTGVAVAFTVAGKIFDKESITANPMDLVLVIVESTQSNAYSKNLSERVSDAWMQKRLKAAKQPMTSRCPGWLESVSDRRDNGKRIFEGAKFQKIPHHVATVHRIIAFAIEGKGTKAIAQMLNRDKTPVMGRCKHWEFSAIQKVLHSRALIGEFQPGKRQLVDGKLRQLPEGEPIKGYYPAILTDAEFLRLQGVLERRAKLTRGRPSKRITNIFGRVMRHADGGTVVVTSKRTGAINLSSMKQINGLSDSPTFPIRDFEAAFLTWVKELDIHESQRPVDVDNALDRWNNVKSKADKVQARLDKANDDEFDRLLEVLAKLNAEEKQAKRELQAARTKMVELPAQDAHRSVVKTLRSLTDADDETVYDLRLRLRTQIQQLVKAITLYTFGDITRRVAIAKIELADETLRLLVVRRERNKKTMVFATPKAVPAAMFAPEYLGDMSRVGAMAMKMNMAGVAASLAVATRTNNIRMHSLAVAPTVY